MELLNKLLSKILPKKSEKKEVVQTSNDPLDVTFRQRGWKISEPSPIRFTPEDFPVFRPTPVISEAMDAYVSVMDDSGDAPISAKLNSAYAVPNQLQNWYMSQSFIGYQSCAIIAQHWLVDKACSMAGADAIRNGWDIKATGDDCELQKEDHDKLRSFDVHMKIKENLSEFVRFKNIFGIRIAIFQVDSDDPLYYEKPFNLDGVTENSYKGISQIDPYWVMPMMTAESTADPSGIHFYDPEYWVISGKKYHRTHLIISRGPQPADVLKPTYIFGGVPLTQRIYERVYAAERTANEAPLLSLSKRTTALHVDVEKALTNQKKFEDRLEFWIKYRDNHGVKVMGKDETMDQFDTNLSDFDSIIMNQYQLVSAIAEVPATKLLGTSPKGFNATGEFEMVSYHEKLESIQEHDMAPMLERHYLILGKSLGIQTSITTVFEPVDSVSTTQKAELNDKKADTAQKYINMGAVAPDEVRQTLRDDKRSGYNRLTDEDANESPGMSPENISKFQEAGAAEEKGEASLEKAGSMIQNTVNPANAGENQEPQTAINNNNQKAIAVPDKSPEDDSSSDLSSVLSLLTKHLIKIEEFLIPNNQDISNQNPDKSRTSQPSVNGLSPSVAGVASVTPKMEGNKLPKMKVGGIPITIENPKGTIRQGMNIDGDNWANKMTNHYGYIRGVEGADGDELDCFIGPNLNSDMVFVINQNYSEGDFDEHKCMLGFDSAEDAKAAYDANFPDDWDRFGSIVSMNMAKFKNWISSESGCTLPLSEI